MPEGADEVSPRRARAVGAIINRPRIHAEALRFCHPERSGEAAKSKDLTQRGGRSVILSERSESKDPLPFPTGCIRQGIPHFVRNDARIFPYFPLTAGQIRDTINITVSITQIRKGGHPI